MVQTIKSVDANHLIIDGTNGFYKFVHSSCHTSQPLTQSVSTATRVSPLTNLRLSVQF